MLAETEAERGKRHRQRSVFDAAAELYDAVRPGYPAAIVDRFVSNAGVARGNRVLEIGCGTGQLTRQLVQYGFVLTAIDPGPTLIAVAGRHLAGANVDLQTTMFEDFDAADQSFELIVSASAFHWVDPDVRWTKAARLLRSGGWLALLGTSENYDEPFGSALLDAWVKRSADGGAWATARKPSLAETIADTGLFEPAILESCRERGTLASGVVLRRELTRATSLSYDTDTRAAFTDELRDLLEHSDEVGLEQHTQLTMAHVRDD